MIPKIVHYCWLSDDPIPQALEKCMSSWKKHLNDYEFILWNFSRFPKDKVSWVSEAYDNKKYAFAADYIRLYALYNYGGFYLDMDVEVCKSLTPFTSLKTVLGWQRSIGGVEVAAFGVEKKAEWVKKCLEEYEGKHFIQPDGTFDMLPLPNRIESALRKMNFEITNVDNVPSAVSAETNKKFPIFSYDYFSPKSYLSGRIKRSKKTVCIHHFSGSWLPPKDASFFETIKNLVWKKTGFCDLQIKKRLKSFIKSK